MDTSSHSKHPLPAKAANHNPPHRSPQEVTDLKAARQRNIERRCQQLVPPISLNVLHKMETFKNALLVATPLTENGWKMLKPQLLGQRKAAEQKEKIRVAQSHVLEANQDKFLLRDREYRAAQEAGVREREYRAAQEARVRERERAQTIRALLDLYSDDFTKQWRRRYKFEYGELRFFAIPQFAALLLIDVRQRFYEHIAAKDAAAKTRWRPAAPFPRKLTLVDMRRVCDAKIKPLLEEKFQKELFLCRFCCSPSKYYELEGVVQHYAAKHTATLSTGSTVVCWGAEWPLETPFHPDPAAVRGALCRPPVFHFAGPLSSMRPPSGSYGPAPPAAALVQQAPQLGPFNHPHFLPLPDDAQRFPGQPRPPPGPYVPFQSYAMVSPSFGDPAHSGYQQDQATGHLPAQPGYQGTHGTDQDCQRSNGRLPSNSPHPSPAYPIPVSQASPVVLSGSGLVPWSANGNGNPYNQSLFHPMPGVSALPIPISRYSAVYQYRLEVMAWMAHGVWSAMAGLDRLPAPLKVFVTIHQVARSFQERFATEPDLPMFRDGLIMHPVMSPLKEINGLSCKTCDAARIPVGSKQFILPALASHFQDVHLKRTVQNPHRAAGPALNWKVEMILLPNDQHISNLLHKAPLDHSQRAMFSLVFPEIMQNPMQASGSVEHGSPRIRRQADAPLPTQRDSYIRADDGPHERSYARSDRPQTASRSGRQPREHRWEPYRAPSRQRMLSATSPRSAAVHRTTQSRAGGYPRKRIDRYTPAYNRRRKGESRLEADARIRSPARRYPDGRNSSRYDHQSRRAGSTVTGRAQSAAEASRSPALTDKTVDLPRDPPPTTTLNRPSSGREPEAEGSEDGEVGAPGGTEKQVAGRDPNLSAALLADRFLDDVALTLSLQSNEHVVVQPAPAQASAANGARFAGQRGTDTAEAGGLEQFSGAKPQQATQNDDTATPSQALVRQRSVIIVPPTPDVDSGRAPLAKLGHTDEAMRTPSYYDCRRHPLEPDHPYHAASINYDDERNSMETARRPRSRFDRYESLRQENSRARSRSPQWQAPLGTELVPYRQAMIPAGAPSYRTRSPVRVYLDEYPPADVRGPEGAYDSSRYTGYIAHPPRTYDLPMEYVSVRQYHAGPPPPQAGYYVLQPRVVDDSQAPEYYHLDGAVYADDDVPHATNHPSRY